jgi:hypothetical protein
MIKIDSCRILIQLERTIDIAVIIILKLQDARDHIRHMLFILFGTGLVRGGGIALLLNNSCRLIERAARHIALLTALSCDVEDETIGGKLLSTFDHDDMPGLAFSPRNGHITR